MFIRFFFSQAISNIYLYRVIVDNCSFKGFPPPGAALDPMVTLDSSSTKYLPLLKHKILCPCPIVYYVIVRVRNTNYIKPLFIDL
jgi:hypothetical protein